MIAKRRRFWIVTGCIALPAILIGVAAALHRDSYAFLDRFHPKRVELDATKFYGSSRVSGMLPHYSMLEFNPEQAPDILAAMKRELTASRGFSSANVTSGFTDGKDSEMWEFAVGTIPAPTSPAIPDQASEFVSGPMAAILLEFYESGVHPKTANKTSRCIVLLVQKVTWVDRAMSAFRRTLHLAN